ncbi:MAG: hypothetical protein JSU05_01380 [Bacteroidetes bacterium]|nr:hypothetical protein [Bacteroidota bacterium]
MKRNLPLTAALLLIVFLGVFSCRKEYSFEKAAGTLKDSLNNCSPIQIAGHYRKGIQLTDDSFFVTLNVNVTKTGVYKIYTDQGNGFMFSDSGKFTRLGIQQVRLKASGSPIKDTLTYFNCYFDNSICSFSIPVGDSGTITTPADTLGINTWQFTDETNGNFHSGLIDTTNSWFIVDTLGNRLQVKGWPGIEGGLNHDTLFVIAMYLPHSYIDTGIYSINEGVGASNVLVYTNKKINPTINTDQYFFYYNSYPDTSPDFIFHLLSYDANRQVLKGTFMGSSIWKRDGNYTDITFHYIHGSFSAKLY